MTSVVTGARDGDTAHDTAHEMAHDSATSAERDAIDCRAGCGACCIAPSITTPFRGMPHGKRAGERCVHLDDANLCRLFGQPDRPAFCVGLRPTRSMCGATTGEALAMLAHLELATRPDVSATASARSERP